MSRSLAKLSVLVAVLSSAVLAAPALAEERSCTSTIVGASLDNVHVPQGSTCVLRGSSLNGTLLVESDATLLMSSTAVNGNVQAEGARSVYVRDSRIGGAFQVRQGGAATLLRTAVKGTILLDTNAGAIRLADNSTDDNIQAFHNTGGVSVVRNRVKGNLQCKANDPAPTGGANEVHGVKEDQCAAL